MFSFFFFSEHFLKKFLKLSCGFNSFICGVCGTTWIVNVLIILNCKTWTPLIWNLYLIQSEIDIRFGEGWVEIGWQWQERCLVKVSGFLSLAAEWVVLLFFKNKTGWASFGDDCILSALSLVPQTWGGTVQFAARLVALKLEKALDWS